MRLSSRLGRYTQSVADRGKSRRNDIFKQPTRWQQYKKHDYIWKGVYIFSGGQSPNWTDSRQPTTRRSFGHFVVENNRVTSAKESVHLDHHESKGVRVPFLFILCAEIIRMVA